MYRFHSFETPFLTLFDLQVTNADNWLKGIGEGEAAAEESPKEGAWKKTDHEWIVSREGAKALRQELLGY